MSLTIIQVETDSELEEIRTLFREYETSLDIDLAFQDFETELATLPGKYASPKGAMFLAYDNNETMVGCIAVRPFDGPMTCEIKRLYVRPSGRGTGAGRALANQAIHFAHTSGYKAVLLDTLPTMATAIALYRDLGFEEVPPYWQNNMPDILYFRKQLKP